MDPENNHRAVFLKPLNFAGVKEATTRIKLCYSPGACSLASHIVLQEAGAQFELVKIDLGGGEQRTEQYLKINPNGRVPALILDDGRTLFENIGIMTYVARSVPGGAKLIPTDPFEGARCYSLMSFFASSVHVAFAHNAGPSATLPTRRRIPRCVRRRANRSGTISR